MQCGSAGMNGFEAGSKGNIQKQEGRFMSDENKYSSDVQFVQLGDREIIIIGTAHVSKQSADTVRQVIENEKPDCVCVELDDKRYKALSEQRKWESLDIKTIIKQKQLATLMVNLLLASYQKKLGEKMGVMPGAELLEATKAAKEHDIPIALCDRDVRVTMLRAWRSMSFWKKMQLFSSGLAGSFEDEELSEEKLAEMRKSDVLTEMMNELGEAMPTLKRVLIDERDAFLTQKIRDAKGKKLVAVVGAGHMQGIIRLLKEGGEHDLEKLSVIPPPGIGLKIIGWGIPALILGSIGYIGYTKGFAEAGNNLLFWILVNGVPCSIGAALAFAHPFTVIASFFAAPITSLTPVMGAGYVAAFIQAYYQPPLVKELQTVSSEIGSPKNWWKNRLLKIFLVLILTTLGSGIGTYVGAWEIMSNLF